LKKLAVGLEISVPQLFTPPAAEKINGRMAVTKSGDGTAKATTTYEHELLGDALRKKQMLPYRARIRARSMEEFDGWVRHDGEEFLYVLTGVVQLFTEFYEPVELRRGDRCNHPLGHLPDLSVQPSLSKGRKIRCAAPTASSWARMNIGICPGLIPANVSENPRAIVTAGLAKLVDEVNQ
jgi:hypothetical protein